MAWFFGERRGPQWKHGWREQTLSSLSLPPPQLIAIFAIVILFLSVSWYADCKTQVRRTEIGFRFLLFLLPAALIVVARYVARDGGFVFRLPRGRRESIHRAGGSSPWGVLLLVLLLLVMVSYQSSFHSQWFRPLWRMD
ncbi:hypothetical protein BHE74_00058315 [Ensete ventricosum]|uniref:Uncharacterized protein n=1 Tax=Ensete ventricosum TaxID=4639 RepID=A0A427A290_ENSVE|nr:hypothetical protein B296_00022208 [Ensete ventricosum]RWW36646.1 hypothetical protein BHE74_00058315 [Ensete ventricosum]RZS03099.1 hypothetical protein BHM03_00033226 [Ensete ventricosum]